MIFAVNHACHRILPHVKDIKPKMHNDENFVELIIEFMTRVRKTMTIISSPPARDLQVSTT